MELRVMYHKQRQLPLMSAIFSLVPRVWTLIREKNPETTLDKILHSSSLQSVKLLPVSTMMSFSIFVLADSP